VLAATGAPHGFGTWALAVQLSVRAVLHFRHSAQAKEPRDGFRSNVDAVIGKWRPLPAMLVNLSRDVIEPSGCP
jgi:hypothetical protein